MRLATGVILDEYPWNHKLDALALRLVLYFSPTVFVALSVRPLCERRGHRPAGCRPEQQNTNVSPVHERAFISRYVSVLPRGLQHEKREKLEDITVQRLTRDHNCPAEEEKKAACYVECIQHTPTHFSSSSPEI